MILFLYVLREFFKYSLLLLILAVFLFTIFDLIHQTSGYFQTYKPSMYVVFKYYFYQLPFQIVQSLPIVALLSSAIVAMRFYNSHEITVARSLGISPWAILTPFISGGLILSLFAYSIAEFLIPPSAKKLRRVIAFELEKKKNFSISQENSWIRKEDLVLNYKKYDSQSKNLLAVKIFKLSEHNLKTAYYAEYASQKEDYLWDLHKVDKLILNAKGELVSQVFQDKLEMLLPFEIDPVEDFGRKPDEMSISELFTKVSTGKKLGLDVLPYEVAMNFRMSYPLAAFLVSFLSIVFAYRRMRSFSSWREIIFIFGIALTYWFLISMGRAMAHSGILIPVFSTWIANLFLLVVIVGIMRRVHRV